MTAPPKGDSLVEEVGRLHDVVEDHERLLRRVVHLNAVISKPAARLEGPGGILAAGKTREQLLEAQRAIKGGVDRLYLKEI